MKKELTTKEVVFAGKKINTSSIFTAKMTSDEYIDYIRSHTNYHARCDNESAMRMQALWVPIGIGAHGEVVELALYNRAPSATLITGVAGCGKSAFITSMVSNLLTSASLEAIDKLTVFDGEGVGALSPDSFDMKHAAKGQVVFHSMTPDEDNETKLHKLYKELLVEDAEYTIRRCDQAEKELMHWSMSHDPYAVPKPRVLILDDWQRMLVQYVNPTKVNECRDILEKLIRVGYKQGIFIVLCGQSIKLDGVEWYPARECANKLCLRLTGMRELSKNLLGIENAAFIKEKYGYGYFHTPAHPWSEACPVRVSN